jgi:lysophospholipase L1-like esterase
MRTILCYGDSNTWGYEPGSKRRLDHTQRWPGVLREDLSTGYLVIEEGLNGRTTVWTDPLAEYRNGKHLLLPCLETHKPLDLVILMLGTNDLKRKFSASPYDIARGVAVLITIIQTSASGADGVIPEILLLCPPPVGKLTELAEMFEGAEEKSRQLARHYRSVASEFGCHFLNTGDIIRSSDIDGIHLEPGRADPLAVPPRLGERSVLRLSPRRP